MEPLTWGLVGSVAVQEGIKFLYGQLKDAIDRARKNNAQETCAEPPKASFATAPEQLRLSPTNLRGHEAVAETLMTRIEPLVSGPVDQDPGPAVLAAIADLRALIESLSGQRFTFAGEAARAAPITKLDVTIRQIRDAHMVGAEAKHGSGRDFDIRFTGDEVGPGANVTLFRET